MVAHQVSQAWEIVKPCANQAVSPETRKFIDKLEITKSNFFDAKQKKYERERVETARQVDLADKTRRKKEGVSLGMSKSDVLASNWGKPRRINRTIRASGEREQWIYDGSYLYFEGDVLVTIQN